MKLKNSIIALKTGIVKKINFAIAKRYRAKIDMLPGDVLYEINSYIHENNYQTLLILRSTNKEMSKKISYELIYKEILSGKLSLRYPRINDLPCNHISSEFNRAFNKLTVKNSHKFLQYSKFSKFVNVTELRLCMPSSKTTDFPALIGQFPSISSLDLSMYNSPLSFDDFKLLAKYNLKTLKLGYSQYHVGNDVLMLFENLECLSLMHCNNVTDEGIKNFKKLEVLDLRYTPLITTEGLCELSNLRVLTLKKCRSINGELFEKMKTLEIVEYESADPYTTITDKIASYFTAKKAKVTKTSITGSAINILQMKQIDLTIIDNVNR